MCYGGRELRSDARDIDPDAHSDYEADSMADSSHSTMIRRSLSTAALALCLAGLSGCGESDAESFADEQRTPVAASPEDQGRFALFTLDAVTGTARADEVEVTGQFVSFAGPADTWAMEVLDLWMPEPLANGSLDACRLTLDALEPSGTSSTVSGEIPDYRIELLDAGNVTLARDQRRPLGVHVIPDLQIYLSGVVYGLEHSSVPYRPGAAYLFEGLGSTDVPSFNVAIEAPLRMDITRVDGQSYDEAVELVVPRDRDLDLRWRPSATDEVVYVDLYDDARSAAPLLSCSVIDDGQFSVPHAALQHVRETVPDAALRLVARRAHAVDFDLSGFDWARVVFSTSDVVFLTP